ncbi:MAG: hypothetical protein QOF51_3477 [Chloroflexota bacterium]|nr:hypothetical protein [Chloroflexota bacterium]
MRSVARRIGATMIFVALAAWLAFSLLPPVHASAMTALLLPELFNASGPRPLLRVSGEPLRTELRLGGADADLYRPSSGGRHGALVMTLGVHPLDKRDPLVVRVAEGLARTGLVVMIVQSDGLIADRIEPGAVNDLVAAVERLRADDGVDPAHIGILGFSAGASLAFLAAADPRAAPDVRALVWVGGFADALQLMQQIGTRQIDEHGTVVPWEPADLSVYVFRKQLVDALDNPAERAILEAAYLADFGRGVPEARARLGTLSPSGQTLAALFDASDPAIARQLMPELPPAVADRLAQLSPIRVVDQFQGRAFLLVDRADPLVPWVQSRELADALPKAHLARYAELEILEHVQPTKPLPPVTFVSEAWKLASMVQAVLLELDPRS